MACAGRPTFIDGSGVYRSVNEASDQRINKDVHRCRPADVFGLICRMLKSIQFQKACIKDRRLCLRDRVGGMMHLTPPDATRRAGEQPVALHEEEFERPGFCKSTVRGNRVAKGRRNTVATAMIGVVNGSVLRDAGTHPGMMIRQVKKGAGGPYGGRLIAIQREEPDSWSPVIVVNISAHVYLQEIADPWHARQEAWPDVSHEEWHDAHPRGAIEGVHREPGRQATLDVRCIPAPVQKQQVGPRLVHHLETGRTLARRETMVEGR